MYQIGDRVKIRDDLRPHFIKEFFDAIHEVSDVREGIHNQYIRITTDGCKTLYSWMYSSYFVRADEDEHCFTIYS